MSLRLMAPPGVAPGTSAVSLCAHKEDKDARKLLRAGRMSGATRQPCPLHWGHGPTPTKPEEQDHLSPLSIRESASVHLCADDDHRCECATGATAKVCTRSGRESVRKWASKARTNHCRGPPGTKNLG